MRVLCIWLLVAGLASTSLAEPTKHVVTVDDHFSLGFLADVALAPDGKTVAYSEGRWQESTNDRKTEIWTVALPDGRPVRRTFDRAGYENLLWSQDGKWLYFAARRKHGAETNPPNDGSRQVWRLAREGAEILPVTSVPGGIDLFDLDATGSAIIYATSSQSAHGDWTTLRSRFPKVKFSGGKRTETYISSLDLATWRTRRLLEFPGAVDDLAVAPDGKRIALITAPDGKVSTMEGQSAVTIYDVDAGTTANLPDEDWRKQLPSPYGRVGVPKWSADGGALAFAVGFDGYPSEVFVASWNKAEAVSIRKVNRPADASLHGGVDGGLTLAWKGAARDLCFLGDDHGRVRIYCASNVTDSDKPAVPLTAGDVVIDKFAWNRSGTGGAAILSTPDKMADICIGDGVSWTPVSNIHAHTRDWALPKISIVRWKGARGEPVEGILELPANHPTGTKLPLIVNLHGGPTAAVSCGMLYGYTGNVLFASQGYAFFSPNYRGSTGYGDKFLVDLIGRENDIEVEDILKGIDFLVAEGIADSDRIAVAGWSNGGYLTNCLVTKSPRFRAASSGAGIADLTMEWGVNDEPAYPAVFNGGPPWKAPDVYRSASPVFEFHKVKTPMLFHVGENDPRCPKGHSEMLHRALAELLSVPTELLVYTNEQHGLSGYSSRQCKLTWDLAWFDHYLKGMPKPE
jgi:dipeptidyl aminopeptidase/acylaminoacyl peptidase